MIVLDLANRPYHDCFVNCYDSFFMLSAKLKPPSCIYSVHSKFNFQGPLIIIQDTGPSWLEKSPIQSFQPRKWPKQNAHFQTKTIVCWSWASRIQDLLVLRASQKSSFPLESAVKFKILFTRLLCLPGCQSERQLWIALLLNAHTALIFVKIHV